MHRNLYVHRRVLTKDKPSYFEEIAVAHALRTLRDWTRETAESRPLTIRVTLSAGDVDAIVCLKKWLRKGQLDLKKVADSLLIDDLTAIRE